MAEKVRGRSTRRPLLVGLLAGAAMGAALGVVFAPRTGKDTRRAIGSCARRVRGKFNRHSAHE